PRVFGCQAQHETLISAGLTWSVGQSGTPAVGGDRPNILQPGQFFGKGFGDLPASFSFFRPFAITGAITADLPTSREWPSLASIPLPALLSRQPLRSKTRCAGASPLNTAHST